MSVCLCLYVCISIRLSVGTQGKKQTCCMAGDCPACRTFCRAAARPELGWRDGNPLLNLSDDEVVRGIGLRLRSRPPSRIGDPAGDFRARSASARLMACSAANLAAEKRSSRLRCGLGLGDRDSGVRRENGNFLSGSSIGDRDRLRRGGAGEGDRRCRDKSLPLKRPEKVTSMLILSCG